MSKLQHCETACRYWFWLTGENEGVDTLLSQVLTATAKIKKQNLCASPRRQIKKKRKTTSGCTWDVFVCNGVWAPSQTSQCPPSVPVWGQTLAFRWKNPLVYSDENRASQSSQHDITAPEPSLISFINLQLPPQSFFFARHATCMRRMIKKKKRFYETYCTTRNVILFSYFSGVLLIFSSLYCRWKVCKTEACTIFSTTPEHEILQLRWRNGNPPN